MSLQQKAFVQLKYLLLKNAGFLTATCKVARSIKYDRKRNKYYVSWRFGTVSAFQEEKREFYPEQKKVIPTGLLERINPEILAFWYMDDGSQGGNTPHKLCTNDVSAFSSTEKQLLQKAIEEKFDVEIHSWHRRNIKRAIVATKFYFKRRNIESLIDQIKPFFIPSLLYKLPASG